MDQQGRIRDLSSIVPDLARLALLRDSIDRLRRIDMSSLPLVSGTPRLGPCVGHVGKFICIGLNYSDHAAEAGMSVPAEPIVFMKATSAICGPNDNVAIPRSSRKTDGEVELGVVIGNPAKYAMGQIRAGWLSADGSHDSVRVKQSECVVEPLLTPPLPAESCALPGSHQVPPNLLLHPELNVGSESDSLSHVAGWKALVNG